MSTEDTDQPVEHGDSGNLTVGTKCFCGKVHKAKDKKWGIHFDHPKSYDVVEFGAPVRVYIRTPWVFIQIGEKSQRWTRKKGYSQTKWDWVTIRPLRKDEK